MKSSARIVLLAVAWSVPLLAASAAHAGWTNLGGSVSSIYPPAVTEHWDGSAWRVNAYVVNNDTSISVAQINASTGAFTGWTYIGGSKVSPVSAVAWGTHREIFAIGTNFALFHDWSDNNSTWSGWQPLGAPPTTGTICSAPSAVSWAPGRIDVFVMGCDHALWHTWANAGGAQPWVGWENLGGNIDSAPSAVSRGNGLLDVFANERTTHRVLDRSYNLGWVWRDTGIKGMLPPSAVVAPSLANVYVHDSAASRFQGAAYYFPSNVWFTGPSASINGSSAVPHAVSIGDNVQVYYRDANGHVQRQGCYEGFSWFTSTNGLSTDVFAGDPVPANGAALYVFAVKSDSSLWYGVDATF